MPKSVNVDRGAAIDIARIARFIGETVIEGEVVRVQRVRHAAQTALTTDDF